MVSIKHTCLLLFLGIVLLQCQTSNKNQSRESEAKTSEIEAELQHIVLFKFKESATAQEVRTVEKAFAHLPSVIDEISDFEWGTNNSPENLNKEFTHSFLVSFTSESNRDVYLTHPEHLAFVEVLKPHLDDVLVIDYWNK